MANVIKKMFYDLHPRQQSKNKAIISSLSSGLTVKTPLSELMESAFAGAHERSWLDLKTIYSGAMADPAKFNKTVKVFFFSCGTVPPLENPDALKKHQEQLVAAGITNSYLYISPGTSHEWQTWRRSLYGFAPLLFR